VNDAVVTDFETELNDAGLVRPGIELRQSSATKDQKEVAHWAGPTALSIQADPSLIPRSDGIEVAGELRDRSDVAWLDPGNW